MKKVLFATSALVASAGIAAADVSVSGYAEMGISGGDDLTVTTANAATNTATVSSDVTEFHQDIEVTFTMSGTTDNGLSFGASIQLDESAWTDTGDDGGTAVFISGSMGTLTMGDTDGGFDWGMSEVPGGGAIQDEGTGHAGYNGNSGLDGTFDGQVLRYDHSMGGLGFAVSIELDDTDDVDSDPIVGLGLRYSVGDLGIGFGFQSGTDTAGDDLEAAGISLSYSMGDVAVGLNYSQLTNDTWAEDQNHVGIGVSYSMDAISIAANYGRYENWGGDADAERSGFGMTVGYDLGGGASILLGVQDSEYVNNSGVAVSGSAWSLGLAMSF